MLLKPSFSKSAQDILKDRYLWKDGNGEPSETPEQMLLRIANHIASAEKTTALQYKWADEYYDIMANPLKIINEIQAPDLTQENLSASLNEVFEKINDNFKKIVSAPIYRGQKGESVKIKPVELMSAITSGRSLPVARSRTRIRNSSEPASSALQASRR